MNYLAPETRFEGRAGMEADIWALGCAIFETRAGFPLFDPFFGSDGDILRQTVETLGRLSDPWWGAFGGQSQWFEEDGERKSRKAKRSAGVPLQSSKNSIRVKLRSIGTKDDPPSSHEGRMIETSGTQLTEYEIELLGDLLERMLKYHPGERIGTHEVVTHPWFTI